MKLFWKKKQENDNKSEITGVDFLEFDRQRREELLKKNYIKVEIIIANNEMPYIQIRNKRRKRNQ